MAARSRPTRFFLDPRGSERKTTGSYYTHPSLVNELIKSALLPVARDRLAAAGLPVIEEEAIGEATAGLLTDYAGLTRSAAGGGRRGAAVDQGLRPGGGQRPFPGQGEQRPGRRAGPHPHRRRVPRRSRDPGRQARRAGALHLCRGPEPHGRRAVQGQPVDQRQRARPAAQLPRPPHQVRQLADRGHARADGGGHPRRTPLPWASPATTARWPSASGRRTARSGAS